LFWIPSDASVASRHLPHGPHGLGQDRSRARTGSGAALRAGQRRFRPGLSRDGYRHRQALGATAGGLSPSPGGYPRPGAKLFGGTMLYFKALRDGLADMPAADAQVRAALEEQVAAEGLQALHRELAEIDPESAARIHPNDPQRLVRALEVFRVSGMTMSEHR